MRIRSLFLVALSSLFLQVPLWAQGTGSIVGTVADETGGVLPGVTVHVHAGGVEQTTFTNGVGAYRFDGLPAGPAAIDFKLINFTVVYRDSTVVVGQMVTEDAVLSLSLSADVVVTAPRTFRNIADLENPAENLVGIASAASQGAITAAQLEARPIMRPAEILEAVPGFVVSQHSGEGKANQYYLRGFNLDHGSDFSVTIAGVPINTPTGAHFHGYSDTNLLITELVSGVQFKKGPYSAEDGDFSAAGSANVNYVNSLDKPIASFSGGGQGWGRVFAAASPEVGQGNLLMGIEVGHNDGPWVQPDDLRRANGIVRYSRGDQRNGLSLTGMGYSARWNSTDQVPQRAIDSGLITRFGTIDPSDNGKSHRYSFVADGQVSTTNASTRATGYVQRYALNLISNFTYFLDDPVNGDQFEQADRRWATGARVVHRRLGQFRGRHFEAAVGGQVRHDSMGEIGFYKTVNALRVATTRRDTMGQTDVGFFGQAEIEWSRVVRTTIGLRGDVFEFDVDSDNPLNSGSGTSGIVSPKFTAVFGPWRQTEFYGNAGLGYHSNDARGASITVDPRTGDPVETQDLLTRAKGAEFGVRTVAVKGLQSTVALWYLGFDSELLFVGDAGVTEASRPSRRVGLEWANYARINPWMTGELDISFSRARFTDVDPAGERIPGALDRVISGAVTVEPARRVFGSVRLRHFGPRPLVEDGTVSSKSTTIWNGEFGVSLTNQLRLTIEVFNLFDSDVADIDYFYTSRLPGEPLEGVDDIHTHPSIPRTARVALQVVF